MDWNEFRIDWCETWRCRVSCSGCRESSALEAERREDNFLQVSYSGSPLMSHKHAQITCRDTEYCRRQCWFKIYSFFVYIKRQSCNNLVIWLVSLLNHRNNTHRSVFICVLCWCISLCIALMHIRMLLTRSAHSIFIIMEIWCSTFY